MKSFIGFFVRRPLLVNLSMLFIVIAGLLSLARMQYNTFPSFDAGEPIIVTRRPGSSAEDMELTVTTPLEEELLKVDGLEELESFSMEGSSIVEILIDPDLGGKASAKVRRDLQEAVERATSRLASNLPQQPQIIDDNTDKAPVAELLISGDVPELTLRHAARQTEQALRRVQGVAGVVRKGYRKREVKVLLDAGKLHQLGISIDEISNAVQRRNVRDSSGALSSYSAESEVLTIGEFEKPKDIEDVIIRAPQAGNYVRIRDIAEVVYGFEERKVQSTTDGKSGISLFAVKKSHADILRTATHLHAFVERWQQQLPPGVQITMLNDLSSYTRAMLDTLVSNALAGIVLVLLVLIVFFPLRFTIWVAAGIPIAILLSFALMPLLGLQVNLFTLSGLILMLGVLVDDAVVTSESIFRHSESGASPLCAAIDGTTSVLSPVLAGAATTVLAFLPAAFIGGLEGKFMWTLPATVVVVLTASLIECKLMLPAHMRHSLTYSGNREVRSRVLFTRLEQRYQQVLTSLVSRPYWATTAMLLVMFMVTAWGLRQVNLNLYPENEADAFCIQIELAVGTPLEQTNANLGELETLIRSVTPAEDILHVTNKVGELNHCSATSRSRGHRPSWGIVKVHLRPLGERLSQSLALVEKLRKLTAKLDGYGDILVMAERFTPTRGAPLQMEIIGSNVQRFEALNEVMNFLDDHPHTTETWNSYQRGKDIVHLVPQHEAIADHGLTIADISKAVRVAFDGHLIDELQTVEEKIDYRLQLNHEFQGSVDALYSLTVVNKRGKPVPLRALVNFEIGPGAATIKHYFGERAITVFADIDREQISTQQINQDLQTFMKETAIERRYKQLQFIGAGELVQQDEAVDGVAVAFMLSLTAMFFLLVLLFNSLGQPLLVLSTIPVGFCGVIVAFAAHGMPLDIGAMMAMLGLAGVVLNNSLVMIDLLNKHKRAAGGRLDARQIVEGATLRLRPVFITTVTTVAGLAPAAYEVFGASTFTTSTVMAMLWGVLVAGLATVFYLPCLYSIEQDCSARVKQLIGKLDQEQQITMTATNPRV
ncbi:MAG: efflux RND transporter permease subunit [Pseudomonadales bacterium]